MNLYMEAQACRTPDTCSVATPAEQQMLAQWGFTTAEIASLLWLRQYYQFDENEHAANERCLGFLRLLVDCGELEL